MNPARAAAPPAGAATYRLQTPLGVGGALAAVLLRGDVDAVLSSLGVRPTPPGQARVRTVPGVDQLVIARFGPDAAMVMPHAGPAALGLLLAALERAGAAPAPAEATPLATYPEATDLVEACVLETLSRAPSPLAVDLLLRQPARWRARLGTDAGAGGADWTPTLDRLLNPPVVAAIGPSNIGKSSLLNALAGRSVAIVADEPGVTRDHVGAAIDLGGLTVRWIDTPGIRATHDSVELAAQRGAERVVRSADFVVWCADAGSAFLDPSSVIGAAKTQGIRLGLRADLGSTPGAEMNVSAATGHGIAELALEIRDRLLPPEALAWTGAWRFHPALPG